MNITLDEIREDITRAVRIALDEDIGSGDITARLIPENQISTAEVITREECVVCGAAWFDETFAQINGINGINWHVNDGDLVPANTSLVTITGKTRSLLTGERTALNFLQLLSGTATRSRQYAKLVEGTGVKVLDTRKTIPGLRTAQKYAVNIGGCHNHRIGLHDAFLIKENHIAASGGIASAVTEARKLAPGKPVEVEVENLEEFDQAIKAKVDIVMLDNFSTAEIAAAIEQHKNHSLLEISGNVTMEGLSTLAATGVDFISVGDLTKSVTAVDLSLKIIQTTD